MNQLPQQTVKRIQDEAEITYPLILNLEQNMGKGLENLRITANQQAYISGATSEAQRNRELVEALPDIEDIEKLQRSILAADPRKEDVVIKDLKKQIDAIANQFQQALKNYKE